MQVLRKLHKKDEGFGLKDGWHLETWKRTLNIQNKKKEWEEKEYSCWYLIQDVTGHVIVSQLKAWNDTVRMCMWLELVMKPIRDRDGKLLLWMDNCGCHKVKCVEDLMIEFGIDLALFPPNMTGQLQPLDLYVNMPIKANTRKLRAKRIVLDFGVFRELLRLNMLKPKADRIEMSFKASKPLLTLGMQDLVNLFGKEFKVDKFMTGIKNTFIKVGISPMNDVGTPIFKQYKVDELTGTTLMYPTNSIESEQYEVRDVINLYLDEDSDDSDDDNDPDDDGWNWGEAYDAFNDDL